MGNAVVLRPGAVQTILDEYQGTRPSSKDGRARARWFRWANEKGMTIEGTIDVYVANRLPTLVANGGVPKVDWLHAFLRKRGKRAQAPHTQTPARKPARRKARRKARTAPAQRDVAIAKGGDPRSVTASILRNVPATKANMAWLAGEIGRLPDCPENLSWLAQVGKHGFELWAGLREQ